MNWVELEQRFNELGISFQFARIDGQSGAAGEYWHIAGAPSKDTINKFETLAEIAGSKLKNEHSGDLQDYPLVFSEEDPIRRWYKALRFIGNFWESGFYGQQVDDSGKPAGLIFVGSIRNPASVSATLCLQFSAYSSKPNLQKTENILKPSFEFLITLVVTLIPLGLSYMGIIVNRYIAMGIWFLVGLLFTDIIRRISKSYNLKLRTKRIFWVVIWIGAIWLIYKSWFVKEPENVQPHIKPTLSKKYSLKEAIDELSGIEKMGEKVLGECSKNNDECPFEKYKWDKRKWMDDTLDFLEGNPVIHGNIVWKKWADKRSKDNIEGRDVDWNKRKPAPPSSPENRRDDYLDIERRLENINFYLEEMKKSLTLIKK